MGGEKDDIEFQELIAEKRHKELKSILSQVKNLLDKPVDNSATIAIDNLSNRLMILLTEEKPILVNPPDVNVQISTNEFVSSVEKLNSDLLEELRKFNSRPIPSHFDVEYSYGNLKTVKIVYATIDKLNYKK